MNIIRKILNRRRFKKTLKEDQSQNVVDGMVKAKTLYKELCKLAHPDRHQDNKEWAEDMMKRIVSNQHNYNTLLALKGEIEEKL